MGGSSYYAARRSRFSYEPNLRAGLWSIVRYDRSTNERTTLTSGIGGAARPAVSPDGKTLVYVSRRDAGTVLVARTLDTGAERVLVRGLTHDDQEGFAALDVWPNYAFTPDGQSLVYSSKGGLHRLALAAGATPQPIPFTAPSVAGAGADRHQAGPDAARARSNRRSCAARSSPRTDARSSSRHSVACGCRRSRADAPQERRAG